MPEKSRIKRARGGVELPPYDFSNKDMDPKTCHVWYKCNGSCEDKPGCMFCDGGLSACTVCGGFEGSLTTQCPGVRLSPELLDLVYTQQVDFNQNRWWMEHREMNEDGWPKRVMYSGSTT